MPKQLLRTNTKTAYVINVLWYLKNLISMILQNVKMYIENAAILVNCLIFKGLYINKKNYVHIKWKIFVWKEILLRNIVSSVNFLNLAIN